MGLTFDQKKLVKAWVAAGLKDAEIVRLAKEQVPPFHISQQNINKNYRKPTERRVQKLMQQERADEVLRSGLALKENRIRELAEIYGMAKDDVQHNKDGRVRTGMANVARGCLDDIAKELGERRDKVDVEANVHVRDIVAIVARLYDED